MTECFVKWLFVTECRGVQGQVKSEGKQSLADVVRD